jgi:two-component system phosphate regulon sensor histidine kinase PhoR
MITKRLHGRLFLTLLLITIGTIVIFAWYTISLISSAYITSKSEELESRAKLIEPQILNYLLTDKKSLLDSLCNEIGKRSKTRITIILPDGKVIADSYEDPAVMDNHGDRPEILEALKNSKGFSRRYSYTIEMDFVYLAIPLVYKDQTIGVLRISEPLPFIKATTNAIKVQIAFFGIVIIIIIGVIGLIVSRQITHPLEEIKTGIQRFTNGELKYRLLKPKSAEFAAVVDALNLMAAQLEEKINTITEQKNERNTILESMVECVLAVDNDENIISVNNAAARIFHVDAQEVTGRSVQEIIRNPELQALIQQTLKSKKNVEKEIIFTNKSDHYLQVHGTVLKDSQSRVIGAMVVMNDVTRLRRLENVRRDFVANVSHEIRTPLTSIKGFVETLLDGALENRENTVSFLKIIAKQSNRLNAIIEDLLILARLEEKGDRATLDFERIEIKRVVDSAVKVYHHAAQMKSIDIKIDCPPDLMIAMNLPLLEQAIINLIDNAVKYSPAGSEIEVQVYKDKTGKAVISVKDNGPGIEKKHLPRIFERFYRVDKARSRDLGGTGLGLAIVKHIAQVHNGSVDIHSTPGMGSNFFIYLPVAVLTEN